MRRTRRLALAALLCAALATAACASSPSATRDDDPNPAADPAMNADPAASSASDDEQHDARMAAAQSTGPVGGEATKGGETPTESKLTDFDKLDINAALKDRRAEFTACYDDALAIIELPPDGFLVKAKFTIEADGTVKGAEVVEATQRFEEAEQCFLMKLATTPFPAPPDGRIVETTYPFVIKRKLVQ